MHYVSISAWAIKNMTSGHDSDAVKRKSGSLRYLGTARILSEDDPDRISKDIILICKVCGD
jgi:hypothetical protein